jgi:Fur family ferric uptake transcriptional regulator
VRFGGTVTMREADEILKGKGLRCTPGRVRVLRALVEAGGPLSQSEIMERLRGARLDRVSVYRALDSFVAAGIVHRVFTEGRIWMFETADRCGADHCHPHFTCRVCHRTTCLTDVAVPLVKGLKRGFVSERQRVHIQGVCPGCAAR